MPAESLQPILALVVSAAIAFAVGYFFSRNSAGAEKREIELAQRSTGTLSGKRNNAPSFSTKTGSNRRMGELSRPAITSEHQESREFFEKIGVTKEDLRRVEEIEKRRAQGEYILQNERPTTRKFLDYDFGEIVAQAATDRTAEYDRLFAQLGVAPEVSEQLKTHVAKIHKASLEAEVAIQQILQARRDYDQRLRSAMSDEGYQEYRQVEESKSARREYQEFQNFAEQQHIPVDGQHQEALVALIQAAQAYTSISWHGPFEGLPQPIIGAENVIPAEEENIVRVTARVSQLLELSSQAGLPAEYRKLVEDYYAEKIQQKQRSLAELKTQVASDWTHQDLMPRNPTAP